MGSWSRCLERALITKFRTPNQKEFVISFDLLYFYHIIQIVIAFFLAMRRTDLLHSYASFAVHLTISIPNWFSHIYDFRRGPTSLGNPRKREMYCSLEKNPLEKCFFWWQRVRWGLKVLLFNTYQKQVSNLWFFHFAAALVVAWFVCNSCPSYYSSLLQQLHFAFSYATLGPPRLFTDLRDPRHLPKKWTQKTQKHLHP